MCCYGYHVFVTAPPLLPFSRRYNAQSQSLEVCLGLEHIPVGPLTPAQREMARSSAKQSQADSAKASKVLLGREAGDGSEGESPGGHWLVNRSTHSTVKAFSGTGHTLGGSSKTAADNSSSDGAEQQSILQDLLQQQVRGTKRTEKGSDPSPA